MADANPPAPRKSISRWTLFFRVFSVVFLLVVAVNVLISYCSPESYRAFATFKVKRDALEPDNPARGEEELDPHFVETTIWVAGSQPVLSNVVTSLNLNVEWGKKFFNGETLKTSESIEILRSRILFDARTNTMLMAVIAYSDDKNETALMANAVVSAYQNFRAESLQSQLSSKLKRMEELYSDEEEQVRKLQDRMMELQTNLHLSGDSAYTMTNGDAYENARRHLDEMVETHKNLFFKIQAARLDCAMPKNSLVQIMRSAQPPKFPWKTNMKWDSMVGVIEGIILGLLSGIVAVLFVHFYRSRRKDNSANSKLMAVAANLNEPRKEIISDEVTESPNRPSSLISLFFSFFVLVFIMVTIGSIIFTFAQPESYTGTVYLKVKPDSSEPDTPTPKTEAYDLAFMQTTPAIVWSDIILSNVATTLNLSEEWGKKYFGGKKSLTTREVLDMIRDRLTFTPQTNAMVLKIEADSDDKNESALLVNTIAAEYRNFRFLSVNTALTSELRGMEEQYTKQENEIQKIQIRLNEALHNNKLGSGGLGTNANAYLNAKRDWDQTVEAQKLLFAKIQAQKLTIQMPKTSLVQILYSAEPARWPSKPNKTKLISIGLTCGALLGLLAGGLAVFSSLKYRNLEGKNNTSLPFA